MREDDEHVADGDRFERDIDHDARVLAMGMRRHPSGEGEECRRRPADRITLQRLPAGKHEDNERAGEVLAEDHGGDDRNPGQKVRAELEAREPGRKGRHERDAADGERHQ